MCFFWLQETQTTWSQPLHLQLSDLSEGPLISSLVGVIYIQQVDGRLNLPTGKYSQDVTTSGV